MSIMDESSSPAEIADIMTDLIANGIKSTGTTGASMTEMGIVSTGTWFPETYITAAEIAEQSGMPEWVVREKLGIERKFVADPEGSPERNGGQCGTQGDRKARHRPDGNRRGALYDRGMARIPVVDHCH